MSSEPRAHTRTSRVIVRLQGGLGNQLFQYAAGRALSASLGGTLFLDDGRLDRVIEGVTQRAFELGVYPLKAELCGARERRMLGFYDSQIGRLLKRVNGAPLGYVYKRERSFDFDEDFFVDAGNTILDGYWQSERYFGSLASELRSEIVFSDGAGDDYQEILRRIESCNSVSLHFRRGDYLSNPTAAATHPVCGIDYYKEALNRIRETVEDPVCFLFSDDPEWVATAIDIDMPHYVVSGLKGMTHHHELHLMSRCRHHVIANSSFSWWGAWLGSGDNKRVIAPLKWFNDNRSTLTLLPRDWTRI